MKRLLMIAVAIASTGASAQSFRVQIGDSQAIARCQNRLEQTRHELRLTSEELQSCRENRDGRNILLEENRVLRLQVSNLLTNVDSLERENDSLRFQVDQLQRQIDDLTRPAPRPIFDLAESVRACSGIKTSQYAKDCASAAKQFSIQASVIDACTEINNNYFALMCVQSAGKNQTGPRQVKACSTIRTSQYAADCVTVAGSGNVPAKVITSCVESTNNDYYRLECVKQMAN